MSPRLSERIVYRFKNFFKSCLFAPAFLFEKLYRHSYSTAVKLLSDSSESPSFAVYDLRISPITYDFVHFLGAACYYFSQRHNPNFSLIIVNDNCRQASSSPWEGYRNIINRELMRARIYRILIPLASCFSNCRDNIKLVSPNDIQSLLPPSASVYPVGYSVSKPISFDYKHVFSYILNSSFEPDIHVPSFARDSLRRLLENMGIQCDMPFLTLTLRSYQFQPNRNTSSEEINRIAHLASLYNLPVIVVPDSDSLPTEDQKLALERHNFYMTPDPALDALLRLALYKKALINFMNLNGPMCIAILSKTNSYIMNFSATNNGNSGAEFSRRAYGIIPGSQPYARFGVEIQWSREDFTHMESFFLSKLAVINGS